MKFEEHVKKIQKEMAKQMEKDAGDAFFHELLDMIPPLVVGASMAKPGICFVHPYETVVPSKKTAEEMSAKRVEPVKERVLRGSSPQMDSIRRDLKDSKLAYPAKDSKLAYVEAIELPSGAMKVVGLGNFLTAAEIKDRLGRGKIADVWELEGDSMFRVSNGDVYVIHRGEHMVYALFEIGGVYPRSEFSQTLAFMRLCGRRLGELVQERKAEIAAEKKAKEEAEKAKCEVRRFVI